MAVKTKDELMESIKLKLGEDTSDETLAFLEDMTDTLDNYESRVSDQTNWKEKYEENDKNWREKYTSRFFEKEIDETEEREKEPEKEMKTFDDLFTAVKEEK